MNKDSLVFYLSQYEAVKELNNEQLGALYRAIFETALGNEPELNTEIRIPYKFIQNQINIDTTKYKETSRKRSEAGKKSGRVRAEQAKRTNVNFVQQNELNDNDNDNDNVNVNDNEGESPETTHDDFQTFGQLNNVRLTATQRAELKSTYQNSHKLIDKVSVWLPNADKEHDDHYALCIKFANNDNWPKRPKEKPRPVPDESGDMLSPEEQREAIRKLRESITNTF